VQAFIAILLSVLSGFAFAEIVDDINLKTDANGEVDAVIKFTVPIQKIRYFPPRKSQYLVIYFNILDSVPRDQWQDYESHRAPPSDSVLGFTVTTRDLNTGPKIEVQFSSPVEFSLKAGKDSQSLYIHIKPDTQQKVPLPAASQPAPPQLGGKDGLPVFPAIELAEIDTAKTEPGEAPTLEEQIKKANYDAAVMMVKGRDAILSGEMFAAIEAFNNVLKLPPNKYSPDAQCWIGIAREKSGQQTKAKFEYESYLKLYPDGAEILWVKKRLAKLNAIQPAPPLAVAQPGAVSEPAKKLNTTEYGSLSMYYYHGASHTDTISTVGGVESPFSLTVTDQSSLISNLSATMRAYNEEYDNRLVFQDFFAANFLPGQQNTNRLNAAYWDVRNRNYNYSARIGRQSAMGGGVLGRFDGVTAGYGFLPDWRVNVVTGQLSEFVIGSKPVFYGASLDFGIKEQLGGSMYAINQTVGGINDRKAVGGYLRYFEQGKTAMSMVDYDTQFRKLNMLTLQGTLNSKSGTDYNFLLDRRRTPLLSIRSSVNGTAASVDTLLQNGWTIDDLLKLAKLRTAISNLGQFGVNKHINEKWLLGTDLMVSRTTGMSASGTLNPDGTTGLEGYVPAMPSTGNTWTISERVLGNDVVFSHDVSMCSVSYTKSNAMTSKTLLLNNHSFISELWTFDTTLRQDWQSDNIGGKQTVTSPMLKLGYRVKNNLTLEAEGGIELTKVTPAAMPASKISRKYYTLGFRWDF